ncbi:MAG: Glu/Leu/Phe/Val dehydrogenase [Chlamydiia bacterium]|nr:Glu/Leu/Phe/Val dehydrogenase [Chlamydiia bacterium]MCB1115311.1 Glu/Leu/Phe/Val dehydrogenase [Chlamydiia bacterium]
MELQEEILEVAGYEKVLKVTEKTTGLCAIIAIHNTTLGPGLGGTRIYPYKTFDEALTDALRLSKGMTYKAAIAQVGLGGAKSVIIADPKTEKTPELLKAFGRAVNRLKGQYICAEDVGCTPDDIEIVLSETKYVCGVHNLRGSGNPSSFTAHGTFLGIQSVLQEMDGTNSLEGKTVAIQGMGSVGKRLAERLFWAGAKLIITDINLDLIKHFAHQYDADVVGPEEILRVECDVFAPCALGGVLNQTTIPHFKCRAIAGAANNQLLKPTDADHLREKGILYAPDFVINAGGLINVMNELSAEGYNATKARDMIHQVYHGLLEIYEIAQQNNISTHQAAVSLADHRIEKGIGKRSEELCFPFAPAVK